MLQTIRDRAQGIVVWTIVGLIIITFALFGLSSYLSGGAKSNIAEVNGSEITQTQLTRAQQNYLQRMQQMLGKNFNPDMFDNDMVKQQVLQGLITREVIQQHVKDVGLEPAPQQVVSYIQSIPAFQEDGHFSNERYQQVLRVQGIAPEQFEHDIASDLAVDQMRNGIIQSAFVTQAELQRYARLKNQQRDIGYLVLGLDSFEKQIKPTDEQVEAFYNANKESFMTPEEVSVNYLELNLNTLAERYDVSEDEIKQYYQSNRDSFVKKPEQREARHILIKIDADQTEAEAKKKIDELRQKIAKGADFAELAKEYSQDPGSASQGGELGYFGRNVMDPAFEKVAFSLKPGEVSQPVKTPFGYHLIKLEKIRSETITPLAEVKDKIRHELQMRQAEQDFYQQVDDLNRYSYEMPDSLAGVADKLGLEVKHSSLFTRRGGKGIFGNPKVINAAFSDEVLQQGRNSEPVELSDTHVMVLHVNKHQPAQQKSMADVRSEIVTQLKRQQAQQLAITTAEQLRSELQSGDKSGEQLARQYKVKWLKPGYISRQPDAKSKLDKAIRQEAFRMPKPDKQQASAAIARLGDGNIAVLELYAVRDGEVDKEPAKIKTDRLRLSSAFGDSEYQATLQSLRSKADITINKPVQAEQ